jgi:ankyrin repeat protein
LQAQIEKAIKHDDVSRLEALVPFEYLDKTFTFGFRTPHPAIEIHPTAESWTALLWASAVGSRNIVVNLLDRGANFLSQKRWEGSNVFHIAALCGHAQILQLLFDRKPELLQLQTIDGETALILAARQGRVAAVETLLAMGADPTVANLIQQTALHAACTNGDENGCRALLTSLLRRSPREAKAAITATDILGASPFDQAVHSCHTEILLQLIETPAYFPSFPFQDQVILPSQKSDPSKAEELLLKWMQRGQKEDLSRHREAIVCWAWLNGREGLINMNHKVSLYREEAQWVHIAAIGGHIPVMKRCLGSKMDILAPARGGITPLHLAATHGHVDLLQYLLTYLSEPGPRTETQGVNTLDAILMATEEGRTVLDCAFLGGARKRKHIERIIWRQVHQFIYEQRDGFFRSQPSKATRVLELAARHAFSGKEKYLLRCFEMMPVRTGSPPVSELGLEYGRNALHWAIYHQQPTVLWWLLANREHSRDGDMLHGTYINDRVGNGLTTADEQSLNRLIGELLLEPPPVIKPSVPGGDDTIPPFIDVSGVYIYEQATVIDFYARDPHICFKACQMFSIIYGKGASEIMSDDGLRTMASLTAALEALKEKQSDADTIQDLPIARLLRAAERKRDHQLRWFHLPCNEVSCIHAVSPCFNH